MTYSFIVFSQTTVIKLYNAPNILDFKLISQNCLQNVMSVALQIKNNLLNLPYLLNPPKNPFLDLLDLQDVWLRIEYYKK